MGHICNSSQTPCRLPALTGLCPHRFLSGVASSIYIHIYVLTFNDVYFSVYFLLHIYIFTSRYSPKFGDDDDVRYRESFMEVMNEIED